MGKPIYFNDLLHLDETELESTKIRFNQSEGKKDPLQEYRRDPAEVNDRWLFWRKEQRYFSVGQLAICLLYLKPDTWLLTAMKHVTEELNIKGGVNYEGKEDERYQGFFGRTILRYHKAHRSQCVYAASIIDKLEVMQILPSEYNGENFPGI